MALLASFFEYFCPCGQYIFRHEDIQASTMLWGINYIFMGESKINNIKTKIALVGRTHARCTNCWDALGNFVFREGENDIRFSRHKLLRRKTEIILFHATNSNGKIIHYQHEIEMRSSALISIPINTLTRE